MGGIGSGRPRRGSRRRVESCSVLDVNALRREGRLRPGVSTIVRLSPSEEDVGVLADDQSLRLRRRVGLGDEAVASYQAVGLVRRPCNLGGERTYFICSGVGSGHACGRRVVKLYATRDYFLCRHCLGLAYACQNENAGDRALRRSVKARKRLGAGPSVLAPLPIMKPMRIHWNTFSRLHADAAKADAQAKEALVADYLRKFRKTAWEII